MRRIPALLGTTLLVVAMANAGCAGRPGAASCHEDVQVGPLPEWATAGFSEGAQVPRVVGRAGLILAVPFSQPLVSSAGPKPMNKVLFVAREPLTGLTPLTIVARLSGTDEVVVRERPNGPGPGTLDLPSPGCWSLTLSWDDQTDTLDLQYVAPPSAGA